MLIGRECRMCKAGRKILAEYSYIYIFFIVLLHVGSVMIIRLDVLIKKIFYFYLVSHLDNVFDICSLRSKYTRDQLYI